MGLRSTQEKDIPALAALAAAKRRQYEAWQPIFHKIADNAESNHALFLKDQVGKEGSGTLLLLHESGEIVDGFLYLRLVNAPPVYAPGGKIAFIDDYTVLMEEEWPSIGKALLEHALAWAKGQGAVLTNIVCGPKDDSKRELLQKAGLAVASEWHVKSL